MKFRWYITKTHLVALIGILVACIILLALSGCSLVTVSSGCDDKGLHIALPVTPAVSVSTEGVYTPVYPVSDNPPAPPKDWSGLLEQIATLGLGLLLGGGAAVPLVSRAKTALKIACNLAERVGNAETDEEVKAAKQLAEAQQIAAGVHALTQKVRGKI